MKKRTILLATFIAICLIVSVSALLIVNANTNNSPPINGQITCHALKENPGGINIVFLASEEDAKKYSDYLLTIVPFSEYRDKLNFYYIPPTEYKADCSLYQNIAVLCNSKENIKAASVCPNDIRVILVSKPASIRSSALKGTLSLNTEHPLQVFAHEIGHGIAYFAEEYLSPGSTLPKGAGNCLKNCEEIQNLPNSKNYGCYPECTTSDYNREFPEGIMRTLHAERYGNLDENLLREKIEKASQKTTVTGLAIGDEKPCSEQQFYLIEGSSVELVQGCPPGEDFQYGESAYAITNEEGEITTTGQTNPVLFTTDYSDGPITAPSVLPDSNEVQSVITVPVTGDEDTLTIYDERGNPALQVLLRGTGARPC